MSLFSDEFRYKVACIAEERYCNDTYDIEIDVDEPPRISAVEDGIWVQAWVWVPNEDIYEDDQ